MAEPTPSPPDQQPEVDGNRLTLLPTGPDRLEALLELIDGAERRCGCSITCSREDQSARGPRGDRSRRSSAGSRYRCWSTASALNTPDDFFTPLDRRGADLLPIPPDVGPPLPLRNHQKLALADDRTGC